MVRGKMGIEFNKSTNITGMDVRRRKMWLSFKGIENRGVKDENRNKDKKCAKNS